MKLNATAFGLACGILWGVSLFLATIWVVLAAGGEHLHLLSRFYLGYSVSYPGAVLGLVYGFIDGFIGGWILAFLYNRLAARSAA